ncbi:hypothetical protein HBI56_057450 [Parastagonospora nodorum]|nr:hypothetical protein HBH53_150430 [Parastagonospora nodorum]KAH4003252.1 hypothetical protein HBI10_070430 [Parastagonospora nodorum]KAH4027909.1 hypothetical protein HBI13_047590 [Parastagonospora nodorum]KAH4091826.1 hypothetical protein HBH46_183300 [Parastagonospora nodorum]KAH4605860.1 hypothetical protein HBH82_110820 [Parastagonospora nodorum]
MANNSLSRRSNIDSTLNAVVQTAAFKLIDYPPKIRLYEVIIWTEKTETKDRKPILSKRMRKLAVQALVDEHFASFEGRVSIQLSAKKDRMDGIDHIPIDHIIVLWGHDKNDQGELGHIEDAFKHQVYTRIANVFHSSRNDRGHLSQKPLSYLRLQSVNLVPGNPEHHFLEKLQFLLHDLIPPASSTSPIGHELQRRIIGKCKNAPTHQEPENAKPVSVDQGGFIPLFYVMHPKLDPTQDRQLRCEVSVSPGLEHDTVLCNPVRSIFGELLLGSDWARDVSTIRSMLVGLEVTRIYDPKVTQGPRCRIWDIRNPDKVRWFQVNGKGPYISVETYFNEHLGQSLLYPGYPYAQIGPKAWVPLEKLTTCGDQLLRCPGLMNERITSLIRDTPCLENVKEQQNMLGHVFGCLRKTGQWKHSIPHSPSFTPRVTPASNSPFGEKKSVTRAQLPVRAGNVTIKAGILYVASNFPGTDHDAFIRSLSGRLFSNNQIGEADPIVRIDPDFRGHIFTMTDTKQLTNTEWMTKTKVPDLELFRTKRPNSIIAVVDQTGRSPQDYLDICADLQEFGNRKLGAVIICVSRRTVEAQLIRHKENAEYFPHLLLQRLRAMHGEANFKREPCQGLSVQPTSEKAPLLVLGGYLSHPPADSAKHCPSVATLVANLDLAMVNWPGEARLQPAWEDPMTVRNDPKQCLPAEMRDLEEMVASRLDAWTFGKPRIVFYRHGLDGCPKDITKDIVQAEHKAIREAMTKQWQGPVDLTYILVHHKQTYPLGFVKSAGTVTGSLDMESSNKYDYDVMYTSSSENTMICSDLQHLTRNLNQSYQQSNNGTIAIALPVHYAKKLASRTFEYIRFAKTNRFDAVPSEQHRLYFAGNQAELGMCQMLNNYLLGFESPIVNMQATAPTAPTAQVPPPRRKNPWHPDLDKKMFYL